MFGMRIAFSRRKAGMSQAALADRLNISPSAVGMYEQNRRKPPLETLIALSEEFGVTVDYLLTGQWQTHQDLMDRPDSLLVHQNYGPPKKEITQEQPLSKEALVVLLVAALLGE